MPIEAKATFICDKSGERSAEQTAPPGSPSAPIPLGWASFNISQRTGDGSWTSAVGYLSPTSWDEFVIWLGTNPIVSEPTSGGSS